MEKFQNKYRIPSARWQKWDYRNDGAYFITICTKNQKCIFGKIINGNMQLSNVGILVDVLWYEIKNHAKNIELGEFVVMPNHIHGILILNGNDAVETGHALSLTPQRYQNIGKNSISAIIGSYKSAVTKHAHRLDFSMEWQERFHDHVIRDDAEYQRIAHYISNNPQKWNDDKFKPC